MQPSLKLTCILLLSFFALALVQNPSLLAAVPKIHTVSLGSPRSVPLTAPGPANGPTLRIRPLIVDARQREWTTGEPHDITDRSFTIRRAVHINNTLPTDPVVSWIWQPGPWLLVDRITGHITALRLPDFDPAISNVVWFRDYAAYCGVAATVRGGLFAVVAQVTGTSASRRVAQQQISKWPLADAPAQPCSPATWQRDPLRATIQPTNSAPLLFDITGTASLIEEGANDSPDSP